MSAKMEYPEDTPIRNMTADDDVFAPTLTLRSSFN